MKPRILDRCTNCGARTTRLWPLAGPNQVVVAHHCADCYPHTVTAPSGIAAPIIDLAQATTYRKRTNEP